MSGSITVKVFRFDPGTDQRPYFKEYELVVEPVRNWAGPAHRYSMRSTQPSALETTVVVFRCVDPAS